MLNARRDWADTSVDVARKLQERLLVNGWSTVDTISDTSSTLDYVVSSSGTLSGRGPVYIRINAEVGVIGLYAYSSYTSTSAYTGMVHSTTLSKISVPSGPFKYWLFYDENRAVIVTKDTVSGTESHAYTGLIESFRCSSEDSQPLLVFATSSGVSGWNDGISSLMTSISGTVTSYSSWSACNPTTASGSSFGPYRMLAKPVLSISGTEVRGSPLGVYSVSGDVYDEGTLLTSSGTFYTFTASGTSLGVAYGPVSYPIR